MAKQRAAAEKRATSRDVARLAGVSQTTVSYVLNGDPHAIGTETRARVFDAARQLGYQPDESARTLRKGHSNEVCLIGLWQMLNLYSLELVTEMLDQAQQAGFTLVTYGLKEGAPQAEIDQMVQQAIARRPLGIISSPLEITAQNYQRIRQMGVKGCVLLGFEPCGYAPVACLPVRQAARLVGEHLLARGHRQAGMLAPREAIETYATEQRILGLRDAGYEINSAPTGAAACLTLYPMLSTLDGARQVAAELARATDRPSAIYGYNDERTSMLLRALHEQGLRVPQDIALVGTDALSFGEMVIPSLTTVQFDLIGLAQRCIQALQRQIRGEALPPGLLDEMHPRLIIRESCL